VPDCRDAGLDRGDFDRDAEHRLQSVKCVGLVAVQVDRGTQLRPTPSGHQVQPGAQAARRDTGHPTRRPEEHVRFALPAGERRGRGELVPGQQRLPSTASVSCCRRADNASTPGSSARAGRSSTATPAGSGMACIARIRSAVGGCESQRDFSLGAASVRISASSPARPASRCPKPPKMSFGAYPNSQPDLTYWCT
jgi:hypothetical protein